MKLTAKVKLQPTPEQHQALLETLEQANAACNYLGDAAWQNRAFNKYSLQKLAYYEVKAQFSLTAQVVVRCISKVADAYKLDRKTRRTFEPHGSIAYDARILRWYVEKQEVSIWTTQGRRRIPFVAGQRQLELLKHQRGESDLVLIDGVFYLFAACEIDAPDPQDVQEFLDIFS
jgi:predicted transposase